MSTEQKVPIALGMERAATTMDPRVRKTESVRYGDAVGAAAIASTEGVRVEYRATGCWVVVVTLAEQDGDTQTGFSYKIARTGEDLDHEGVVGEAVERAARMLGATKPATARVPVLLDPVAASSFLGVLSDGLSAESVQKQRSLFAPLLGEPVAADVLTLVDDGRLLDGPGAAPFDAEGVPTRRTELLSAGVLRGFLHNTYTALRGGTRSTGSGARLPLVPGRRHDQPVRRARRPVARAAPAGGGGRRARAGRERRALGREPDQRRVLGRCDRPAHLGRRARRAGARDDDREHDPRDAPSVVALGSELRWFSSIRCPRAPRRDDARGRLTRVAQVVAGRVGRDHHEDQRRDRDPDPQEQREVVDAQAQQERDHQAAHGGGGDARDERTTHPGRDPVGGQVQTLVEHRPAITGSESRNENRAAVSRSNVSTRAAVIVTPERETPGWSARAWATPSTSPSRTPRSSRSRRDEAIRSTAAAHPEHHEHDGDQPRLPELVLDDPRAWPRR